MSDTGVILGLSSGHSPSTSTDTLQSVWRLERRLDDRGIRVRLTVREIHLSLLRNTQTDSVAQPASIQPVPGVACQRVNQLPPSIAEGENAWRYTSIPPTRL
jgi:hypothetical protein